MTTQPPAPANVHALLACCLPSHGAWHLSATISQSKPFLSVAVFAYLFIVSILYRCSVRRSLSRLSCSVLWCSLSLLVPPVLPFFLIKKKNYSWGWKDRSAVKNACCSCCQDLGLIPVTHTADKSIHSSNSRGSNIFCGFYGHCQHMVHLYTNAVKTLICVKYSLIFFKKENTPVWCKKYVELKPQSHVLSMWVGQHLPRPQHHSCSQTEATSSHGAL